MKYTNIRELPFFEWKASLDVSTGRISGCTYGSKTYFHELRHLSQMRLIGNERFLALGLVAVLGMQFSVIGLFLGVVHLLIFGASLMFVYAFLLVILEFDAEIYSLYHWIKKTRLEERIT